MRLAPHNRNIKSAVAGAKNFGLCNMMASLLEWKKSICQP
jgi:hypothetical protein